MNTNPVEKPYWEEPKVVVELTEEQPKEVVKKENPAPVVPKGPSNVSKCLEATCDLTYKWTTDSFFTPKSNTKTFVISIVGMYLTLSLMSYIAMTLTASGNKMAGWSVAITGSSIWLLIVCFAVAFTFLCKTDICCFPQVEQTNSKVEICYAPIFFALLFAVIFIPIATKNYSGAVAYKEESTGTVISLTTIEDYVSGLPYNDELPGYETYLPYYGMLEFPNGFYFNRSEVIVYKFDEYKLSSKTGCVFPLHSSSQTSQDGNSTLVYALFEKSSCCSNENLPCYSKYRSFKTFGSGSFGIGLVSLFERQGEIVSVSNLSSDVVFVNLVESVEEEGKPRILSVYLYLLLLVLFPLPAMMFYERDEDSGDLESMWDRY